MTDLREFKTQRDIQAGLIATLADQRFAQVTVNDICTAAMVGRSTFYHHYADKYALLEQMVTQRADTFNRLLDERVAEMRQDGPLLVLYQRLKDDAPAIIQLLEVHEQAGDLTQRYLESLSHHAQATLPKLTLAVPQAFAVELYSTTALTAISWSLQHGEPEAISRFMNQLVTTILNTEA
ncbi:TetR/AcrR family transcriptional regulator [Lacticaseibacillus parakribbianus]|uniref:TetR/AcrR family transcriptional regulator n=1 Tax=Lacticaseibacillus parakribbianus TaxID=2970927 RepID=UPI0021CB85B0|nr:TetR/AcrR family transcriptional regulator [Lacticaseibacillus parakribbianus]